MLRTRRVFKYMVQQSHLNFSNLSAPEKTVAELLEERSILQVSGQESSAFLQGLITNDVSHLESGSEAMYAMFLNSKGRVMYDTIIYKASESHTLFLECDSSALPNLERHLKMYRLKKKISIDPVKDLKVWAIFQPNHEALSVDFFQKVSNMFDSKPVGCNKLTSNHSRNSDSNILICRDPRIPQLGLRVLSPSDNFLEMLKLDHGSTYRALRYKLGVGEGVSDLPPDNCFPLEANCDYLHGISFHKGCYLGQELTARTHHTGVVRKRLMPIFLEQPVNISNASKQEILNEKQKSVGKVRSIEDTVGLGLLRITEALTAESLFLGSTRVSTAMPVWWPKEAPKDLESRSRQK